MLAEVRKQLSTLKLAGIARALEEKIQYANEKKFSYLEFLKMIADDEFVSRKNNSLKKRTSKSKMDLTKRIEDFDFKYQASINKMQILDLATCSFIEKKENIIFLVLEYTLTKNNFDFKIIE